MSDINPDYDELSWIDSEDQKRLMDDDLDFILDRQSARRELAERFAHQQQTRAAVDAEIADLL